MGSVEMCQELHFGQGVKNENSNSIGSHSTVGHDFEDLFPRPATTNACFHVYNVSVQE